MYLFTVVLLLIVDCIPITSFLQPFISFNDKFSFLRATTESSSSTFTERNKSWIILVDDEESIRLSVGNYLYDCGYTVTACADGEALLEILTSISTGSPGLHGNKDSLGNSASSPSTPVDLENMPTKFPSTIICDIRMPGTQMDGLQLLDILKNNPRSTSYTSSTSNNDLEFIRNQWKLIPVILLSAKSFTKDRIEGYKRGADVYLSKPFAPEELLSIVNYVIKRTKSLMGENEDRLSLRDLMGDIIEIKALIKAAKSKKSKNSLNMNLLSPVASSSSSALVKMDNAHQWDNELDEIRSRVTLNTTEKEVLSLLSDGHTNGQIATLTY